MICLGTHGFRHSGIGKLLVDWYGWKIALRLFEDLDFETLPKRREHAEFTTDRNLYLGLGKSPILTHTRGSGTRVYESCQRTGMVGKSILNFLRTSIFGCFLREREYADFPHRYRYMSR